MGFLKKRPPVIGPKIVLGGNKLSNKKFKN